MKDAHDQLNLTLTIINEMTIHWRTTTALIPVTNAIVSISYKVGALAYKSMHSKCQCRKHLAVCCYSRTPSVGRSDTNTNYKETEHVYNCPQCTEERLQQCQEITYPCQKSYFISFGTLYPDNIKEDLR